MAGTTRAMKNAAGSASAAHSTVTATATPRVRRATMRYGFVGSNTALRLSVEKPRMVLPVNPSVVQNAVTNSSASGTR